MSSTLSRWLPEVELLEPRKAFVLWISQDPARDNTSRSLVLEGRLEDVETGREVRFRSAQQLISFLEELLGKDGKRSA